MKKEIEHLESRGFIVIPYPKELQEGVIETARLWEKFCSLPLKAKRSLPYSNKTTGVGYEFKNQLGANSDLKENFDLALGGTSWLKENISSSDIPEASEFVDSALKLAEKIKPVAIDFAQQVEEEFGLTGFAQEVENSADRFFIRFIHYFDDSETGSEVATAHADQSGFTFHLFESERGLQCLTRKNKWIDMPVTSGKTVIIPAMQMQLRSQGAIKALCHRVISTTETVRNGRYSAVCFVQLKDTPKYNKEKWGRLQEKAPGFNYLMPYEEFAKLFK